LVYFSVLICCTKKNLGTLTEACRSEGNKTIYELLYEYVISFSYLDF
jgi:hypothetical protein